MIPITLALVLAATVDVPAGASIADALVRAGPDGTVRLGPGVHRAALGRLARVRVEGAGPGVTRLELPEGEDGATVAGPATLSGLSIVAGRARCAVRVGDGGALRMSDVTLAGGACALDVTGGQVDGVRVDLRGDVALRVRGGSASLDVGSARGTSAGVAVQGGAAELTRFDVTGPAREAGVTVAGGRAALAEVTIRGAGPAGIAVGPGGTVEGRDVLVTGLRDRAPATAEGADTAPERADASALAPAELEGFAGACLQLRRGALALRSSALAGCGGAALQASGGTVALTDVDAAGGAAGCFLFEDGARAELDGSGCTGRGPAVAAAGGALVKTARSRWRVDPVLWVDCGSGARVAPGAGETVKAPCAPAR